ncbi:hypothetical protein [Devosia sp. A449]
MNPLAPLSGARKKALSWRSVAARLLQLESSAPLAPDGQPWIRAVEAISGYSANHLRRMTKALALLEDVAQFWPQYAVRLGSLSFSHGEILGRIWEADRKQVEALLHRVSWPTYAALLTQYETTRARHTTPKAAGKLAARTFRARVGLLLRHQYGENAILDPAPYHPYFKPDFLSRDGEIAYDCLLVPGKVDNEAMRRRFVSWATEASFASAFWITLSDGAGIEPAMKCVHDLDLGNVGLLVADDSLDVVWSPTKMPVPDRRQSRSL